MAILTVPGVTTEYPITPRGLASAGVVPGLHTAAVRPSEVRRRSDDDLPDTEPPPPTPTERMTPEQIAALEVDDVR